MVRLGGYETQGIMLAFKIRLHATMANNDYTEDLLFKLQFPTACVNFELAYALVLKIK